MKIIRDNTEIELTYEELYTAHKEFLLNFFQNTCKDILLHTYTQIDTIHITEELIYNLANQAYNKYAEGNGETEYECCEDICENYYNDYVSKHHIMDDMDVLEERD